MSQEINQGIEGVNQGIEGVNPQIVANISALVATHPNLSELASILFCNEGDPIYKVIGNMLCSVKDYAGALRFLDAQVSIKKMSDQERVQIIQIVNASGIFPISDNNNQDQTLDPGSSEKEPFDPSSIKSWNKWLKENLRYFSQSNIETILTEYTKLFDAKYIKIPSQLLENIIITNIEPITEDLVKLRVKNGKLEMFAKFDTGKVRAGLGDEPKTVIIYDSEKRWGHPAIINFGFSDTSQAESLIKGLIDFHLNQ